MEKTLLILTGPTAVGKTQLSISLAQQFNSPIINADSRQIYRELPIGTAAPTPQEQMLVKHYFVGTHSVTETYSAGQYERDAMALLETLFRDRDVVVMSGGGMMYIDSVCNGLDELPNIQPEIRRQISEQYNNKGIEYLQQELKKQDEEYYNIVDIHNPQRLIHALEIITSTGQTYSSLRTGKRKQRPFRIVKVMLSRQRDELYDRINQRVLQMMSQGLEQEAYSVLPYRDLNSLNTVGYKEMFQYFDGNISKEECIRLIQQNSRHYAKRQMTWFRKDKTINIIDINNDPISQILQLL